MAHIRTYRNDARFFATLIAVALGLLVLGYLAWPKMQTPPASLNGATPEKPYQDSEVLGFTNHDFAKLLSFDDDTSLDQHMQNVEPYLTPHGADEFRQALKKTRLLEYGAAAASFRGAPLIMSTGVRDGRWSWQIGMPLDIVFTKDGVSHTEAWKATVLVMPKDDPNNYLGFDQIIITPANAATP